MTISEFETIREKEGDYLEFYSYNLKCYIKRHETLLHLGGYIEIPKIHGFYNKFISDKNIFDDDDNDNNDNDNNDNSQIYVHGGITFDEYDDDKDVLTIGFDCAHHGDLTPYFLVMGLSIYDSVYKDVAFVTNELTDLSEQIYKISPEYYDVLVSALKNINK